jgi:peptidoglycan/LPS O-acetylase OafA/YrhL
VKHILSFDGLRCLAVMFVLVDHWAGYLVNFPIGSFGVTIFFVLSGYLISLILIRKKNNIDLGRTSLKQALKVFYLHRILRIFPLYFLVLFVFYFLKEQSIVQNFWWHFTYSINIKMTLANRWFGLSDHFWSLAVEQQYYLIFPFMLLFVSNKYMYNLVLWLVGLALITRLYFALFTNVWIAPYVNTLTSFDAFGFRVFVSS